MNKLIKKGLWGLYIDYPDHDTEIINESGITLPLGHAGFALVDLNGRSEYYDYGRYGYKGIGRLKNTKYLGNFRRRSIPDMKKGESSENYAKRIGNHLKAATGEKVVVSIVPLPNYNAAKKKLNKYLENRSDYNALTNLTCAGVAADIIRTGRGFGGKLASGIGMAARDVLNRFIFGPIGAEIVNRFPSQQRPTFSDTYKFKKGGIMEKKLIPKALFGTGLFDKGWKWVKNQFSSDKPRQLSDLQQDLKDLGYYNNVVDNKWGNGTKYAIAQALADGYKIDTNKFTVTGSKKILPKKSKGNSVISLLQKLWDIGAFKGIKTKNGRDVTQSIAIDGTMGSMTNQAIKNAKKMGYNVDSNGNISKEEKGIFDTISGWFSSDDDRIKLSTKPVDRNGKYTLDCAAYVNGILEKYNIRSRGDAFEVGSRFSQYLNGYKNIPDPKHITNSDILKYHKQAADRLKSLFNVNDLDKDDVYVTNMYYSSSPHMIDFYNKAKKGGHKQYGTHVGLMYYDKDKQAWMVTHNIHGRIHNDSATSILGGNNGHSYGITQISNAGRLNPWYSGLIPDWFENGGTIKKKLLTGGTVLPEITVTGNKGAKTLPEVMVYGNKGGNKKSKSLSGYLDAGLSLIDRKVLGNDFQDLYIDLNDVYLDPLVDITSPNVRGKLIYGNFFSESENPNTVGTPDSFYSGQLLGDRNIPLSNFNRFVGIENGRIRVGDRSVFGKDTLITPVVNKDVLITGPISSNFNFGSLKNSFILYTGNGENARKVVTHNKVKAFNDYWNKYKTPFRVIQLDSGRYDRPVSTQEVYTFPDYPRSGRIFGITGTPRKKVLSRTRTIRSNYK